MAKRICSLCGAPVEEISKHGGYCLRCYPRRFNDPNFQPLTRLRLPAGQRKNTCACGALIEPERKSQKKCRTCHNAYMRKHRPAYINMTEEQRKRSNARAYLHTYVKRGKIKKGVCEVCGSPDVEAHHEDYDKPLEVRWLCRKHHMHQH